MTYDPWEARESPTGTLPPRPPEDPPFQSPVQEHRGLLRRAGGGIAAGGLLALKLIGNLAFLFKFKFLLSFVISAALYAWVWGWQFGVGFLLLLMVHELGHVIQLRREGIEASAPMFVPFLGAFVAMKELPDNAWTEAKVGLAGPVLGSLGALALLVLGLGGYELYRRWTHRAEPAFKAYHSVTWPQRTVVATVYLGLIAALVFAMHAAYVTPPS